MYPPLRPSDDNRTTTIAWVVIVGVLAFIILLAAIKLQDANHKLDDWRAIAIGSARFSIDLCRTDAECATAVYLHNRMTEKAGLVPWQDDDWRRFELDTGADLD